MYGETVPQKGYKVLVVKRETKELLDLIKKEVFRDPKMTDNDAIEKIINMILSA